MVHKREIALGGRFFEPEVWVFFFIFLENQNIRLATSLFPSSKTHVISPFVPQKFERTTFRNAKTSRKNGGGWFLPSKRVVSIRIQSPRPSI